MALRTSEWRKLPLSLTELCIDTTLRCGQSFRWQKMNDEWYISVRDHSCMCSVYADQQSRHCTLHGRIVSLKQDPDHLHYKVTWPKTIVAPLTPPVSARQTVTPEAPQVDDTEALLRNYFNLHHDLTELYKQWADADPNFRKRAPKFTGVRMLNQDAWEALVGFICSSNNNISRISQMVHKLCLHYGPYIGAIDDTPFHDFPTPASLTKPGVEAHLRSLGFGYRAKYIAETARIITEDKPADWLDNLRNPSSIAWGRSSRTETHNPDHAPTYKNAHEQLLQLTGVGPKVADCVSLMGLGWGEAVPVDTHVWQIAMRDYKFGGKAKNKTLTKAMYDAVGEHFRELWGEQAGWAHSVLFTADLRTFSERGAKTKDEGPVPVKIEAAREQLLVTPIATPMGTPAKRRRPVVDEKVEVKVKVKVEVKDEPGSVAAASVASRKRRRTRG